MMMVMRYKIWLDSSTEGKGTTDTHERFLQSLFQQTRQDIIDNTDIQLPPTVALYNLFSFDDDDNVDNGDDVLLDIVVDK